MEIINSGRSRRIRKGLFFKAGSCLEEQSQPEGAFSGLLSCHICYVPEAAGQR